MQLLALVDPVPSQAVCFHLAAEARRLLCVTGKFWQLQEAVVEAHSQKGVVCKEVTLAA